MYSIDSHYVIDTKDGNKPKLYAPLSNVKTESLDFTRTLIIQAQMVHHKELVISYLISN